MIKRYTWNSENFESLYIFPDKNILITFAANGYSGEVEDFIAKIIIKSSEDHNLNLKEKRLSLEEARSQIFEDIFYLG